MSAALLSKPADGNGRPVMAKAPRELEIVLNGPVGPQRMHDDTVVIEGHGWYRLLTPSTTWPAANEVFFSNLNAEEPEAEIASIVAEYHQRGLPLTWCVYPWTQPADLGERLRARGATKSVIAAFLGSTASAVEIVEGVEIEQVDPASPEAFDTYFGVLAAGYRLPPDELAFRRRRYRQLSTGSEPFMKLFLARSNGVAAGCAAMVIKEDSGHMTGVHVVPEFQGRGMFQSLVAARLRVLREMGIALATGHANEQSAFWAKRFGLKEIYSYTIYQLDPPSVAG